MKKLLWIGDAGCQTGFAKATHGTLDNLGSGFAPTVLAMNYPGDPHSFSYPLYAAASGRDSHGLGRLLPMLELVRPDVVVIQSDPWLLQQYVGILEGVKARMKDLEPRYTAHLNVPLVASVAVDGENLRSEYFKGYAHVNFWTEFARAEARRDGFMGEASVIPLGVDVGLFKPGDRHAARRRKGFPEQMRDAFVVGNVNRNQQRKRLDLTIRAFAKWTSRFRIEDAWLYLHVAPTGDSDGIDCEQFVKHLNVRNIIMREPNIWSADSDADLADTYNCFDVQLSTTQGEGFGLTTFEGMACGVPQIVPRWSALAELAEPAAVFINCPTTAVTSGGCNVIGGVPDVDQIVEELDFLYRSPERRAELSRKGLQHVRSAKFNWPAIGRQFTEMLEGVISKRGAKHEARSEAHV